MIAHLILIVKRFLQKILLLLFSIKMISQYPNILDCNVKKSIV